MKLPLLTLLFALASPVCPPPPTSQKDKRWTEQWGWVSKRFMQTHRLKHGKWVVKPKQKVRQ